MRFQTTVFLFTSLFTGALCQSENPAAVFISSLDSGPGNITFAFSAADPTVSEDVYFHISGPSSYSYIGIGTGTLMKGALELVMYTNATGDGITLSPRLATDNNEPVFSPSFDVDILPGSKTSNGIMAVNARCKNCLNWAHGSLDLNNTAYPWNYALGPNNAQTRKIMSNSMTANLEMHVEYGLFTMDMTKSIGISGAIPSSTSRLIASSATGLPVLTSNFRSIVHAVLASVSLVFLLPTGVIFLRFFPGSVRWHWVSQTLSSAIGIMGMAVGLALSTLFNKSKSFASAHQVIGYIICAGVLAQWFLGFWHHRLYKKKQTPTRYGLVHRNFGHFIFLGAIVNAGIGLSWSSVTSPVMIGYSVAAGVVAIVHFSLVAWKRLERRKLSD